MAMARVLAPIHLELVWLSEKIEAVEASNAQIWQMAAIVSLAFFLFIPFSLKECRTGTDLWIR